MNKDVHFARFPWLLANDTDVVKTTVVGYNPGMLEAVK